MKIEWRPWDATEYLKTPEQRASYVELVLEEDQDSPTMMARTVALAARARGGIEKLAEESGFSSEDLSKAIERQESLHVILEGLAHTYRAFAEPQKVASLLHRQVAVLQV